jgi:predicted MFS family arabinose efflux permease
MAQLQVATAIGSVLGPLVGGWIFDSLGFRAVNILAAGVCFGCTLATLLILPGVSPRPGNKKAARSETRPRMRRAISGLLLAIVLVQTGKMMPQTFFGLYAEQVLGTPAWVTGLCYGATALGLCLAAPFWGKRFESRPRPTVLMQVEWICWACAAIVAVQAVSRDIALFVLARLLWGFCLAALLPVFYGLLSQESDTENQGRVLGLGNSAAKAGALVGAGTGGLTLAWLPVHSAFWPVVAVYVLAALGLRLIRRTGNAAAAAAEHNAA